MNKKAVYIILAVVVLALLTQLPGSPLAVFSYEGIDPSAKEYVFPGFIVEIMGKTMEEQLETGMEDENLHECGAGTMEKSLFWTHLPKCKFLWIE